MGLSSKSSKDILTKLQYEFLERFFQQTQDFFLTGGTALAGFYLFHRRSEDIDLFTGKERSLDYTTALINDIAQEIGGSWAAVTSAPAFRRYLLQRGEESVVLDCVKVKDIATLIVPDKPRFGEFIVDSIQDICANKLCTILARAEMKDYIDVYFLHKHGLNIKDYIRLARRKDAGMSAATLAFVLSEASFHDVPSYMLQPVSVEEIRSFYEKLCDELACDCFPENSIP